MVLTYKEWVQIKDLSLVPFIYGFVPNSWKRRGFRHKIENHIPNHNSRDYKIVKLTVA